VIGVTDWWAISQGGRGMWQGVTNMEGWARRLEGSATEYDIMWMESYAREVEYTMTSDWNSGTLSATATVTASWCQGVEPGASITIHDDTETFTDAVTGCKGVALRSEYADANTPGTPYYKTVRSQRAAERASVVLYGYMCGDDPEIDEGTWEIEPHGEETFDPGVPQGDLETGTIVNTAIRQGKAGDIIWVNRINKQVPFVWRVYDVTRHPFEDTNRVYVDGSCLKRDYLPSAAKETCEIEETDVLICWEDCA
jgi:hypothetical protein